MGQGQGILRRLESSAIPTSARPRPGANAGQAQFSSYYLVKPFKFGLDPQIVSRFDSAAVSLRGTLIYRDNQTMIEVANDSIKSSAGPRGIDKGERDDQYGGASAGRHSLARSSIASVISAS